MDLDRKVSGVSAGLYVAIWRRARATRIVDAMYEDVIVTAIDDAGLQPLRARLTTSSTPDVFYEWGTHRVARAQPDGLS